MKGERLGLMGRRHGSRGEVIGAFRKEKEEIVEEEKIR